MERGARVRALIVGVLGALVVAGCAGAPTTGSSSRPSSTAPSAPTAPLTPAPHERVVSTVDEIRTALAEARPGDTITVADGTYVFRPRLEASANGSAGQPITLRGSRAALLASKGSSGDYGLWITGDHWVVQGLSVAHASKGIVLDGSEGSCSTGRRARARRRRGLRHRRRGCALPRVLQRPRAPTLVGARHRSAQPAVRGGRLRGLREVQLVEVRVRGPREPSAPGDNTERTLVEDNTFTDVPAEGADLKEGTDSGTLRRNTFRRTGASGANSADSAVNVKGNGWLVEGNTVLEPEAPWDDDGVSRPSVFADGFQSHAVVDGYGVHDVFTSNTVDGAIPGFGVGLYPAADNVVRCDNSAPGAALGLAGDSGKPVACSG